MEFKYPADCSFCHSRIGSKDCLLPYEFVCKYQTPTDDLSKVMDVSELHSSYGLSTLQYNFEFVHRVRSRPTSEAIQSYAASVSLQSVEHLGIDEEHRSSPTPANVDETLKDTNHGVQLSHKAITSSVDEMNIHSTAKSSIDDMPHILSADHTSDVPTPKSYASAATSDATPSSSKMLELSTMPNNKDSRGSSPSDLKVKLSRQEEDHIIVDLFLASTIAHAMTTKKMTETRVLKFFECMDTEIGIKQKLKHHYVSKSTTLDHPIALAKELLATHSDHEILSWQESRPISCSNCCILNYPSLSSSSLTEENDRLVQVLVNYCSSILKNGAYSESTLSRLSEKFRIKLDQREHLYTYNWLKSKLRSISTMSSSKSTVEQSSNSTQLDRLLNISEDRLKILNPGNKEHKCPAIDLDTLELLEANLASAVSNSFESLDDQQMDQSQTELMQAAIFNLVSEFVKHNKSWQNPNSLASTKSLQKAADYANLNIPESELTNFLWLCSETVKLLRDISKAKKNNP